MDLAPAEVAEVQLGDTVLRLDGTVVELLHKSGVNNRFHVNHVAVEAKPRREGGLSLHVGVEIGGVIQQGMRGIEVPAAQRGEVEALFERARSLRDY